MENSKICRLCLCSNTDSIELFGEVGREMKIASMVSQHFWFEPAENDNFSNLICSICWNHLNNFHKFYTNVKLAQDSLLTTNTQKISLPDCDVEIVKQEVQHLKYEANLSEASVRDEAENDLEDDKFDNSSEKSAVFSSASSSRMSEIRTTRTRRKRKIKMEKDESEITNPPKRRGRPPKNKENTDASRIKFESTSDRKPVLTALKKIDRRTKREEEDQKIRDFFELACKLCEFRTISFVAVKVHYRQVHAVKRGYVSCCDKKFFRRGRILEHIAWHGNPDTFQCPICHKSYQDTHALKVHMPNHATEDERIYKCDLCGKTYAKKYNLSQHIRITHVPDHMKIHKCPTCGKAFGSRSILHSHIRGVHEFAYASVCDICAKVFKSKGQCALHRHQEHSEERKQKIQCTICETWHKNENGLYKHIRRSHQQTPQSCGICGKVSPNRDALRSHIRYVHESERLHKCSVCEKAFKKPIELKEHMASHTGGILYVCSFCPKTFNSNANMHAHRKKVHPAEWQEDKERKCGPSPNV